MKTILLKLNKTQRINMGVLILKTLALLFILIMAVLSVI